MNNGTLAPFMLRWWWVLLIATLVAAGVGYAASTQIEKTYEAETQLLVGPLNTTLELEASGTLARTYAQLGLSRIVLARAIDAAGSDLTPKELLKQTSIESNEITRIIVVRVQQHSPQRAARLANAIGARLIDLSSARRASASSGLDAFKNTDEITALRPASQERVIGAAQRIFADTIAGRLHVTDMASVPAEPVKPSIPLLVILAALGGFLLTTMFALIWDSRHPEEAAMVAPTMLGRRDDIGPAGAYQNQQRDRWGALIDTAPSEIGARELR